MDTVVNLPSDFGSIFFWYVMIDTTFLPCLLMIWHDWHDLSALLVNVIIYCILAMFWLVTYSQVFSDVLRQTVFTRYSMTFGLEVYYPSRLFLYLSKYRLFVFDEYIITHYTVYWS